MRVIFAVSVVLGVAIAGAASAQSPQDQPPSQTAQPESDSAGTGQRDPAGAGANSFIESQAKKLIESKGYGNVSALVNDSAGDLAGHRDKRRSEDECQRRL